ncbi:MAG TPA: hypothetical protein VF546_10785 [Pyrinomonadaceae bacterium]|jgi:hypothetical protein
MRVHRLIGLFLVFYVAVTVVAALRQQGQPGGPAQAPPREQQQGEAASQLPVADYDAPEPPDPETRTRRRARGKKFDNSRLAVDPSYESTTITSNGVAHLPALPVAQSNTIVLGQVTAAQAYLSNDKTGVYSEFSVRLAEVLKGAPSAGLDVGNTVTADRLGGAVRFPSGKLGQYSVAGLGMPRAGRQYLLFLNCEAEACQLLTGYELRAGRVWLLDNPGPGHPMNAYHGAAEAKLLNDVRGVISASAQ